MWRVSSVLEINGLSTPVKQYAEETRIRGTAVHAANEALAHGYTPRVGDPAHEPYIQGLRLWYLEVAPQIVATERRIVNRSKRLTGQLDIVTLMLQDRQLVPYDVDIKTGSEAPWHGIQTAGYKDLAIYDDELWALMPPPLNTLDEFERDQAMKRAILYLPGNGRYVWKEQKDPGDYYRFASALGLLQWRHDKGLLSYVDPEQPDNHPAVQVMHGTEGVSS